MSLYSDISPQTFMLISIAVSVLFVIVMMVVYHDMRILDAYNHRLEQRFQSLRLHNMLDRLGISHNHYFRKTSDMDKERHIWVCEHCPNPDMCNSILTGEKVDPQSFCPNYGELKRIHDGNF